MLPRHSSNVRCILLVQVDDPAGGEQALQLDRMVSYLHRPEQVCEPRAFKL